MMTIRDVDPDTGEVVERDEYLTPEPPTAPHPERAGHHLDHGGFAMVLGSAIESDLSDAELRLYSDLVKRQGPTGYAPYGQQWLADKLGWTTNHLRDVAERLEERGIIQVTRAGNGKKTFAVMWCPAWGAQWVPDEVHIGPAIPKSRSGSKLTGDEEWSPDGSPLRQCTGINGKGKRCGRDSKPGSDRCASPHKGYLDA